MTEFKGTPGPWEKAVRTSKTGRSQIIAIIPKYYGERRLETILQLGAISEDDCCVETCCCVEEHANAKLIAAAPELLEALQELIKDNEEDPNKPGRWLLRITPSTELLNKAVAAINKALNM